jgi:BioD-like phosphotransacetylase family protein
VAFYFAASQFAKERRLEEEYAFKATISQSLDPYRKLLDELRKEKGDADFVMHLMLEAFKNPARSVYGMKEHESSSEEKAPVAPADRKSESTVITDRKIR